MAIPYASEHQKTIAVIVVLIVLGLYILKITALPQFDGTIYDEVLEEVKLNLSEEELNGTKSNGTRIYTSDRPDVLVYQKLNRQTGENVSIVLSNISYEIRASDYAIIDRIDFEVFTEKERVQDVFVYVYIWDENDPLIDKTFIRARIPFDTNRGNPDYTLPKAVNVRIPINDINLIKTLKLTVADAYPYNPKAFVSLEYTFNISAGPPT